MVALGCHDIEAMKYPHTAPKYPICVCGHSHERFNTLAPECLSGCGCMNYETDVKF